MMVDQILSQVREHGPELNEQAADVRPDPITKVLDEIAAMNQRKRADYAAKSDIFSNFKEAAFSAGLRCPGQSVEALIGTKDARLRQLLWHRNPEETVYNEAARDTLLDRAVYSVIALAMYDAGLYE